MNLDVFFPLVTYRVSPRGTSTYTWTGFCRERFITRMCFKCFWHLKNPRHLRQKCFLDNSCLMSCLYIQEKRMGLITHNLMFEKVFFRILYICISNCHVIKTKWTVAAWNSEMKSNHLSWEEGEPPYMQASLNISIIVFLCLIIGVWLSSKCMLV